MQTQIKALGYFLIIGTLFSCGLKAEYSKTSAPWNGSDLTGTPCSGPSQGHGPFDYTDSKNWKNKLRVVEKGHFTKEVEMLKKGTTTGLPGDIHYTLNAFPNHHRALYAMMRFQLRRHKSAIAEYPPIECYFQRAMYFQPADYRVMQLYANYLIKKEHFDMAINVYNRALGIKDVPLDINYSLGLLYFDLKNYDMAVEQAKIAYGGGIKKSKLKNNLKKIKRWPIE